MKSRFKHVGVIVAIAAFGLSTASCLTTQVPALFGPRPVVLTISGIPDAHVGRFAEVFVLSVGTGLDSFISGGSVRGDLGLATSLRTEIGGNGAVTIPMYDAGTEEPFTTSGMYVIGFVVWTQEVLVTPLGPTIPSLPIWGGVTADMNITGGPQGLGFAGLAGIGLN